MGDPGHDLASDVAAGRFRADLRARLLGAAIEMPALRDRPEDLSLVIAALLERAGAEPTFTVDAARALCAYAWQRSVPRSSRRSIGTAETSRPSLASSARIGHRSGGG